jgi:hypothetical protein
MASDERFLRAAGVIFGVALVVHAADHFRRGMDVLTTQVSLAGNFQFVMAAITLFLIFTRRPAAPYFAIVVGFVSALGFVGAHLLPHWGAFSDSFTGAHHAPEVTWFSWFAALFEIAADLLLGYAGVQALRRAPARVV